MLECGAHPAGGRGGKSTNIRLTSAASARVVAYAGLAGLALLGGLAFGRPELTILAVPFLLAILVGALITREHVIESSMAVDRLRLLEGEEAVVEVRLLSTPGSGRMEVTLDLVPEVVLTGGPVRRVSLPAGETVALRLSVRFLRWGLYDVGHVRLRWRDPLWLYTQEGSLDQPLRIRVYPRPEVLRALVRPTETQVYAGNQLARTRGDGIEFAEIRAFRPGDRVRHINWHATGRRGTLQVNDLHPERNSDVILFLDTFRTHGDSIDRTLRAAIGVADLYLKHRDRVGVIAFGGTLRWIWPGMGIRQRYLLVEAILDTRIELSYAWKTIDVIPPQTLPAKALVIALSPLVDERFIAALDQLSGRGFDLAICEVAATIPLPTDAVGQLAARILALRRDTLRARYHQVSAATSVWPAGEPLETALEEVRLFRRHARRRPA
ncbi:MAG TPA: DUF58 domain-containing protein [Candidatus Dormibacteraeota bacterium]|nr:DUF58 domain-containing protein [Candidatus Dormibacteraeota bacterium]